MNLNSEQKFFAGVFAITIILVIGGLALFSKPGTSKTDQGPTYSKEQLITADTPTKGPKDAPVYLVEFSDFQCPACLAFQPTIEEITKKYSDKLLFAYRFFPLTQIHPQAMNSSQAAFAAGKQGKFWEMHDLLFQNQSKLSDSLYTDLATELKLNPDQFKKDFDDSKDFINSELNAVNTFGINSTPTFFLNGKQLILNSQADLVAAVDAAFNSQTK